jgi:hypothetical protein
MTPITRPATPCLRSSTGTRSSHSLRECCYAIHQYFCATLLLWYAPALHFLKSLSAGFSLRPHAFAGCRSTTLCGPTAPS